MQHDRRTPNEPWWWKKLEWALQALAMPAKRQLALYPDFVCKAEELAFDFDEACIAARSSADVELSSEQRVALEAVDRALVEMSRGGGQYTEDTWTDDGVRTSSKWAVVRLLAIQALGVFGWPAQDPPQDPTGRGSTYVEG